MEISIETLAGTSFELRVSPFETVISVKQKIQRLEGNFKLFKYRLLLGYVHHNFLVRIPISTNEQYYIIVVKRLGGSNSFHHAILIQRFEWSLLMAVTYYYYKVIKLKYSKHEKYIKWPSSHAFFILPHTTLLWAMWTRLLKSFNCPVPKWI